MTSFKRYFDEKELLSCLSSGDQEAFTQIYNTYWKKLFFIAANKLQSLSEAEEMVQDIFLDLWRRRAELNISVSLSSYLSSCVKYRVINILARRNLELRYQQYAGLKNPGVDLSTEHSVRVAELKRQIFEEVTRLPDKCRMVFQLSREQGYSQKQIARHLGISEKTVEAHLSKAIKTLRTSLNQFTSFLLFFF